jgi:hypothetical protein
VVFDAVTSIADGSHDLGMRFDAVPHAKEGRPGSRLVQQIQNRWGCLRIWAVVER